MKRFATVLLCLAFVFGGIAGCATNQQKPEAPAIAIPDRLPVVETVTIVGLRYVKSEQQAKVQGCDGNVHIVDPLLVDAIMSDGTNRPIALAVVEDKDCNDYGLFTLSETGGQIVAKFKTPEEAMMFMLEKLRGKELPKRG